MSDPGSPSPAHLDALTARQRLEEIINRIEYGIMKSGEEEQALDGDGLGSITVKLNRAGTIREQPIKGGT